MAKIDDVDFGITVKLTVSNETAECCLRLLEAWLNDHKDMYIAGGARNDDGKMTPLSLERRK